MQLGKQIALVATALVIAPPANASAPAADKTVEARPRACPAKLDDFAKCYSGRDRNGAWYLAAVPKAWNRKLVVHAHGGPRLGEPKADDSDEDLERYAVMVRSGFAWIGSTYRRGGYGVRMAASDVDNSRQIFWDRFGKPDITILHGQSYGGNVAAKLAELGTLDSEGKKLYDGVLFTNALLWGGTQGYGFRADLRAVYQYYCRNHPRPDEPQYPAWQGLPREAKLTRKELEARVNECLGTETEPAKRTPEQKKRLANVVAVTGIGEKDIQRHLEWATFTFEDMVQYRLDGRNPFDNSKTVYSGSDDDRSLNNGVERFAANPVAVSALGYDSDLSGQIVVPTLALHWKDDPVVSSKADVAYEKAVASTGNAPLFLRLSTAKGTHSRLADAEYLTALSALLGWIERGAKPTWALIRPYCEKMAQQAKGECNLTNE